MKAVRVQAHIRAGKKVSAHSRVVKMSAVPAKTAGKELTNRLHPDSSFIEGLSYNPKNRTAYVKFKSGQTYTYEGVPPELFKKAGQVKGSFGKFYHQHLKNKFTGHKL